MRRIVWLAAALFMLAPFSPAFATPDRCVDRLLILSAYPGEIDMLLTQAGVGEGNVIGAEDGRTFYLGNLEGHDVVLALSGIGLVNARETTEIALEFFRCEEQHITGIIFSGVAGGPSIGDVMIPERWELAGVDYPVDAAMYAVAETLRGTVALESAVPPGDVACAGADPRLVTTVEVLEEPEILPGGFGSSADGFGDRAFPCFPGGGDVFGCRPCRAPGVAAPDVARFVGGVAPFADPSFFLDYFQSPPPPDGAAAVDMETGAVARVAAEHQIPFIAFRGASDGGGDPLMLPGFPFQFFVYRQLAADNAARVTLAFLDLWAGP